MTDLEVTSFERVGNLMFPRKRGACYIMQEHMWKPQDQLGGRSEGKSQATAFTWERQCRTGQTDYNWALGNSGGLRAEGLVSRPGLISGGEILAWCVSETKEVVGYVDPRLSASHIKDVLEGMLFTISGN